jgi:hypothetical protein
MEHITVKLFEDAKLQNSILPINENNLKNCILAQTKRLWTSFTTLEFILLVFF